MLRSLVLCIVPAAVAARPAVSAASALLQPAVTSIAPAAAEAPVRSGAPVHIQNVSLAAVATITGVEPPSSKNWVIVDILLTVVSLLFFIFELYRFDYAKTHEMIRKNKLGAESLLKNDYGAATKTETAEEKRDPELHKKRWLHFALMLICVIGYDLYQSMPTTFFNGETQVQGLSLSYAGVYLSGAALIATATAPFAKDLLAIASGSEIQRIAIAFLAVVSIPQGLASHSSPGGFVALTLIPRLLEGLVIGISETTVFSVVFYLFPPSEVTMCMGALMGIRGLINLASAPIGGTLYAHGGMVAPYLFVGGINFVTVLLLSCLFRNSTPPQGKPSGTMLQLAKHGQFLVMVFNVTAVFFTLSAMGSMIQPWVGVAPYSMPPEEISVLLFCSSGILFLSATTLGQVCTKWFGPVVAVWIAHIPIPAGLMIIGAPPIFFPNFLPTKWMAYLAVSLVAIGVGILVPSGIACFVVILDSKGVKQKTVAASLAGFTAMAPLFAQFLGPLVVGSIIAAAGVPAAAILVWGLIIFSLVLTLIFHRDLALVPLPREETVEEEAAEQKRSMRSE